MYFSPPDPNLIMERDIYHLAASDARIKKMNTSIFEGYLRVIYRRPSPTSGE
jgi:hypothetical protein